jgi:hypothetical protein
MRYPDLYLAGGVCRDQYSQTYQELHDAGSSAKLVGPTQK